VLNGRPARYAVNIPFVNADTFAVLSPFMKAAAAAGILLSQLTEGQIKDIRISYDGESPNTIAPF